MRESAADIGLISLREIRNRTLDRPQLGRWLSNAFEQAHAAGLRDPVLPWAGLMAAFPGPALDSDQLSAGALWGSQMGAGWGGG